MEEINQREAGYFEKIKNVREKGFYWWIVPLLPLAEEWGRCRTINLSHKAQEGNLLLHFSIGSQSKNLSKDPTRSRAMVLIYLKPVIWSTRGKILLQFSIKANPRDFQKIQKINSSKLSNFQLSRSREMVLISGPSTPTPNFWKFLGLTSRLPSCALWDRLLDLLKVSWIYFNWSFGSFESLLDWL